MQRKGSAITLLIIVIVVLGSLLLLISDNPVTGAALYKRIKLGLDLQGGAHVVLRGVGTPERPVNDESMSHALTIIRRRVDKLGIQEPIIQRQGPDRIIVELAGVKDPEEAIHLIGKTALLEFVDEKGNVIITGDDLIRATAEFDPTNKVIVRLELRPEAKKKFAEATTLNYEKPIFIYLDKDLIQAPVVRAKGIEEPIIEGYESLQEAQNIAMLLTSGALPINLEIIENRTISATLGQDSIRESLSAGLVGLIAVALFMVLYYRGPGLVADFALVIYGIITILVIIALGQVLTLPGIAGLILSLGMAVDGNVIIFERIKEELKNRKTMVSAIDAGFSRAFSTIFDANVTTLLGALILFYFGAGPIRGFAVTLSVGILVSMLTAVVISRYLLRLLVRCGMIKTPRAFSVVQRQQSVT